MTDAARHRLAVVEFYERVWNQHDVSALASLVDPEVNFRGSLSDVHRGPDGIAAYVDQVHRSLGDYRCEIEQLVVDDVSAAARVRFSGIHRAPLLGVAATGRNVAWLGAAFFRFRAGLMTDVWVLGDLHVLKHQLDSHP